MTPEVAAGLAFSVALFLGALSVLSVLFGYWYRGTVGKGGACWSRAHTGFRR